MDNIDLTPAVIAYLRAFENSLHDIWQDQEKVDERQEALCQMILEAPALGLDEV